MAQTSDEIVKEIELERERLAQQIDELETYVRDKADIRAHFERQPWSFLGGAAMAGVLLALVILPGRKPRR